MQTPTLAATTLILSSLVAQSPLTTQYTGGAGSSANSIVFFEITATNSVSITQIDCNLDNGLRTPVGLDVWIRGGTFVGNELNAAGWSMVASGSASAVGVGSPTPFVLNNTICVPAGTTLAFALEGTNGGDHRFSNMPLQTYSNSDLSLTAGTAGTQPIFGGLVLSPRVFDGAVHYTLSPGCVTGPFPAAMVGVGEAVAGSGMLSTQSPQPIEDGWNLRWNFADTSGTNGGKFGAIVANFGVGGSPPIGVTAFIPGFDQIWSGSTPAGFADVFGPNMVGASDAQAVVPAGLFAPGDVVRFQGLILDANAPGILPALPTSNTVEFVHRVTPTIEVRCDGPNTFNADTSFGFFSVENISNAASITNVRFDWVGSSNSAQATMEFDTDQPTMADVFAGGNSTVIGCLGTYRNNSATTTGLIFDGANTVPGAACDPTALSGWTGSTPGNGAEDWRTLEFRFTNFTAGKKFEFDCDTDGGAGIGGDDMAGMVVSITLSNGTILTGEVQAAGPDLGVLAL